MRHSKTLTLLSAAVLLLVGASLVYIFLFVQIGKERAQAAALQESIGLQTIREERFRFSQRLLRDLSEEGQEIDGFFVSEASLVEFLETIESFGDATGASVRIGSVNVTTLPEAKIVERLTLVVVAEGSWRALFHFLTLLETVPYRATIDQATLDVTEKGWRVSLSIDFLKLK